MDSPPLFHKTEATKADDSFNEPQPGTSHTENFTGLPRKRRKLEPPEDSSQRPTQEESAIDTRPNEVKSLKFLEAQCKITAVSCDESELGISSNNEKLEADLSIERGILTKVAKTILNDWLWLGRSLGLKEEKLKAIKTDCSSDGVSEMCYQTLLCWVEQMADGATVPLLAKHLKKLGNTLLAEKILKMDSSSKKTRIPRSLPYSGFQEYLARPMTPEQLNRIWVALKLMLDMKHKRLQIPRFEIPRFKDLEINLKDYIDLTMNYKNAKETNPLHIHEIFKSKEGNTGASAQRILIEGPAGYGKSTLAHKLCFDHAKGEEYIQHVEAVILLHLRGFQGTLEEMIINTLQLKDYSAEEVFETIKQNQNKILFILDGWDELHQDNQDHIIPLLQGNQLPGATVIVTSRESFSKLKNEESDSSVSNLLHCVHKRIVIKGVTGENRIKFLKLYFFSEDCDSSLTSLDKKYGLSAMLDNKLFDSPLFLIFLGIVSPKKVGASFENKTQLYKQVFNFLLQRMKDKEGQTNLAFDFFEFEDFFPPSYVQLLSRFGSLAGEALVSRNYFFTEEKILEVCRNDRSIFKLGILFRKDSISGQKHTSGYEPVHLSFLEFSFAYHVWDSVLRLPNFFDFSYPGNIEKLFTLLQNRTLVMPFLFGICGKKLPALVAALKQYPYKWMKAIAKYCNHRELISEGKLKPCEIAEAFLPLVPTECLLDDSFIDDHLMKEAVMHVAQKRKQRLTLRQDFIISDCCSTLPLKIVYKGDYESHKFAQSWCELLTSQNLRINHLSENCCIFALTLCEAPLDQQLTWLSNFIKIEGFLTHAPIQKIKYWCPESQISEIFNGITELIRQEKLVRVTLDTCLLDFILPPQEWREFICCAIRSKQLLDLKLVVCAQSPLFVDLGDEEGKKWGNIEVYGDIVPRKRSLFGSQSEPNEWDLQRFIHEMPSHMHALHVVPNVIKYVPKCVFIQHEDSCLAHNLRELYITFTDNTLLQSCNWEYFQNLQVLAIGILHDFNMNEQEIINSLLYAIEHCSYLRRLELWNGVTKDFTAAFLQRFSKETHLKISSHGKNKYTDLRLDTLMLSPYISRKVGMHENNVVKLLKDLLQSGSLSHLWISRDKYDKGYAKRKFVKLFAPAEGFKCEVAWDESERSDLWQSVHCSPMFILKIAAS